MIPEIGFFLLIIAFFISLMLGFLPLLRYRMLTCSVVEVAGNLERWHCFTVLISFK